MEIIAKQSHAVTQELVVLKVLQQLSVGTEIRLTQGELAWGLVVLQEYSHTCPVNVTR